MHVRFDSVLASCAEFWCQGQWFGWSVCSYVFCFVLLCFAWSFMLVRKAQFLWSRRVFSHIVYCSLFYVVYFEFRCSMCGICRVTQLYDFVFSQVLFVLCCWVVLMLRLHFVRHDARSSWIVPLLSCRCYRMSCWWHVFLNTLSMGDVRQLFLVHVGLVHGWFLHYVFGCAVMVCHSAAWVLVMLYESPRR